MSLIYKKYQVFVSSTYEDLKDERQEVMHALLEINCIPSGMELFPASNEDQWTLIKKVIDECDYFIVIIGGRYGSIGQSGIGYTEMEYRYAAEVGKPIIAFLHRNPGDISVNRSEKTTLGLEKLEEFRKLAMTRMVKLWENPKELGGAVMSSLISLIDKHPGKGWIRGDQVANVDVNNIIINLKKEIAALEDELHTLKKISPEYTGDLSDKNKSTENHHEVMFLKTGDVCPISGMWQAVDPKVTAPIAFGSRMPPFNGRVVKWMLDFGYPKR